MNRILFLLASMILAGACGGRVAVDAPGAGGGAGTGGGGACPLGESPKSPGYCLCDTTTSCPAGYTCCMPFHITADVWPSVCVPPGDPLCDTPSPG